MAHGPDIFTKRGIVPPWEDGGEVARAQGFLRYAGNDARDWTARRDTIGAVEPLYLSASHPDERKEQKLWASHLEHAVARMTQHDKHRALLAYMDGGYIQTPEIARLDKYKRQLPRISQRAWQLWLRRALSVDGWLLPRHSVLPENEHSAFSSRPVAQLRPDMPVVMGSRVYFHNHYSDLTIRRYGKIVYEFRAEHEVSLCDMAPREGEPGYPHPHAIEHEAGAFLPTGHLHPRTGELVVPFKDAAGKCIRHQHYQHAKYLYTPGESAKRLGTNPLVFERGLGGPDDLFCVVLEGTLKMCSVVEAGYPAIDAGSVTLWGGGREVGVLDDEGSLVNLEVDTELEEFARERLEGRPVAVICDSDWHANHEVGKQTGAVVELLKGVGADAVACAPPEGESLGWVHPLLEREMRAKIGVDDWLGEHGGSITDLVCRIDGLAPTLTADDPRLLPRTYRSRRENAVNVLLAMGRKPFYLGENVAYFTQQSIADELHLPASVVEDAFRLAVERGLARRIIGSERYAVDGRMRSTSPLCEITADALPSTATPTLGAWLQARPARSSTAA